MENDILEHLVDRVSAELPGGKRKRLLDGIAVLKASLDQGSWTPRGSLKVSAATSQGLCRVRWPFEYLNREKATPAEVRAHDVRDGVEWALTYGRLRRPALMAEVTVPEIQTVLDAAAAKEIVPKIGRKLVTAEQIHLWVRLLYMIEVATLGLDRSRPAPVITAIGLSPRVTSTFTECGLDLDLPSIKLAEIAFHKRFLFEADGSPKLDRLGEHDYELIPYVKWSDGIAHDKSRFSWRNTKSRGQYLQCHACGKGIPSCMFVPIEAWDKRSQLKVSLWLGVDCASNIFGIKDIGIEVKNEGQ